jgi:hypothetical protein
MEFTIVYPIEKYYRQRVALRISLAYNKSIYRTFWVFFFF